MNNEKTLGVALTKCYYCGESGSIVINRRLSKSMASKVEELNGMVIDMEPCSKCAEFMRQGVILITIDDAKSGKDWYKADIPNPYRTGGFFVVRDSALSHIQPNEMREWALEHRWMFIEHEAAEALGLFDMASVEA